MYIFSHAYVFMHITTKNSLCFCLVSNSLVYLHFVSFIWVCLSKCPPDFCRVAIFKVESKELKILQLTGLCHGACCSVVQCDAAWCSVLQRVAECCSVLQSVAECCSVLQLLQRVAACCSVL